MRAVVREVAEHDHLGEQQSSGATPNAPATVTHMTEHPEHVARNRSAWDAFAPSYVERGREQWERNEPNWGIYGVPEAEVGMLPARLEGLDAVELGCGTGYVSSWLARRGARPVGID